MCSNSIVYDIFLSLGFRGASFIVQYGFNHFLNHSFSCVRYISFSWVPLSSDENKRSFSNKDDDEDDNELSIFLIMLKIGSEYIIE
ncbi:hypothetical protein Hdeb2414_s0015g00440661 [Helianthus debilis subsp. tardiflorus]